ncbi:MAG: TonB-dependent receptor [Gammaproteobacteria bacterium]|nr:TonB-dependent receptor [Gammaproteobacteria bacterium]
MCHSKAIFLSLFSVLSLPPASAAATDELAEIVVLGSRERLERLAGGAHVLTEKDLADSRVLTVNEALRKVPGVFAREEEGLGLRPNIGIRGLNPTRSTKVLLLEDGLPLAFAPYGDNASYFHPSIERFNRIEVLKNSGQIAFGPQTVGGLVNYISADPPESFSGRLAARGGGRGYRDWQVAVGDTLASTGTGWRLDATRKQSAGSRENIELDVTDVGVKLRQELGADQSLTLRASLYRERSQVPYSGLTLAEFVANPRANAFVNDFFDSQRRAAALTHGWQITDEVALRTSVYATGFDRDWWRQSSSSTQRPNDASDPACLDMRNLNTGCGNEGRLRSYTTFGIEPRLNIEGSVGTYSLTTLIGLRHHREHQHRQQVHGDTPRARTAGTGPNGGLREDNLREVDALSGFIETSLTVDRLTVTPGVRVESIRYTRSNKLTDRSGSSSLTQFVPGIGVTYKINDSALLFAGVHRGFSPPRVEDAIRVDGASVELEAELSWNREVGLRFEAQDRWRLEGSLFEMDFINQIVPASLAGGSGATLTNAGRTLHRGAELAAEWRDERHVLAPTARVAWTWLPVARYSGTRYSAIPGHTQVNVGGNRLPYAARHSATVTLGLRRGALSAQLEGTWTGAMYGDDLNIVALSADGQRGRLGGHAIANLTLQYHHDEALTVYASAKNLLDRLYLGDLSRGIVVGPPRLLHAGFEYRY